MNEMFYRQSALDCIANGLLKNYRNGMYLYGAPRSIPIEEIIEVEYKLTIEYVKLRKSGNVLGQTVFENCFVPVYDKTSGQTIQNIRFVDDGVTATVYENGVTVWVNTSDTAYISDMITVPASDFVLVS